MKNRSQNIATDFIWYLFGTALPMTTLFFRSVIYTRVFTTEEYGAYSLVFITFTYLTAISFQGITNNAWRYYHKYKNNNNLSVYKATSFWLYLILAIVLVIICTIWRAIIDDVLIKRLISLGLIFSITNELFNTIFVPDRLDGKVSTYNKSNIARSIVSFALLIVLTFYFDYTIEAFFIAPIISNILFITPKLFKNTLSKKAVFHNNIIKHIQRFTKYGSVNLFYNLGLFLLISSDRYIIALFYNYDKIGIYNQTYNIGQLTVAALISVLNSTINPILTKEIENKPKNSDELLKKYFINILFIMLPLTLLLSLFSKDLTNVLLGNEFREAWNILPLIFSSGLFLGLNYFFVLKIKFTNNYKTLMTASLMAAAVNIFGNFIFIPIYGYKVAAVTTLVSYVFLFIFLLNRSSINLTSKQDIRYYKRLLISCIVILSIDRFVKNYILLDIPTLQYGIRVLLFALVYTMLNFNKTKEIVLPIYKLLQNRGA